MLIRGNIADPSKENLIFVGSENFDVITQRLAEPFTSAQVYCEVLQKTDQPLTFAIARSSELQRLTALLKIPGVSLTWNVAEIEIREFTRIYLCSSSTTAENIFYQLSGREDKPYVVTVRESFRPKIFSQNRLQRFHPNIDLLLKELIK